MKSGPTFSQKARKDGAPSRFDEVDEEMSRKLVGGRGRNGGLGDFLAGFDEEEAVVGVRVALVEFFIVVADGDVG